MKCMSHDMSKTRLSIYQECVVLDRLGAGEPAAWYLEAPSGYPWGGGGNHPEDVLPLEPPWRYVLTAQHSTVQYSTVF